MEVEVESGDTPVPVVDGISINQVLSADANISCASCAPATKGVFDRRASSPNGSPVAPSMLALAIASVLKSEQWRPSSMMYPKVSPLAGACPLAGIIVVIRRPGVDVIFDATLMARQGSYSPFTKKVFVGEMFQPLYLLLIASILGPEAILLPNFSTHEAIWYSVFIKPGIKLVERAMLPLWKAPRLF